MSSLRIRTARPPVSANSFKYLHWFNRRNSIFEFIKTIYRLVTLHGHTAGFRSRSRFWSLKDPDVKKFIKAHINSQRIGDSVMRRRVLDR